jgi:hypothetical protein
MTHIHRKSAGCSLLWAEGFPYSLDVLYGGLEINKFKFLIKIIKNCQLYFFSSVFGHQNPGSGFT